MRPPYIAHMHAHATIHRSTARMRLVAQAVRRVFAVPLTRPIRLADRVVVIAIALCTRGISVELVRAAGSHHAVRAFGEIADVIRCLAVEAWVAEQFRYDDILRGPVTKRIPVVFVRPHIGRAQRVPHHHRSLRVPEQHGVLRRALLGLPIEGAHEQIHAVRLRSGLHACRILQWCHLNVTRGRTCDLLRERPQHAAVELLVRTTHGDHAHRLVRIRSRPTPRTARALMARTVEENAGEHRTRGLRIRVAVQLANLFDQIGGKQRVRAARAFLSSLRGCGRGSDLRSAFRSALVMPRTARPQRHAQRQRTHGSQQ